MSAQDDTRGRMLAHYEKAGTLERILAGWRAMGGAPEALAAVDEFHIRGPMATKMLLDRLDLPPGARFLDVGSGLGGPARALAKQKGYRVTGLDLSASYCQIATELSRRVGLADTTDFQCQDVADHDRIYDGAWTLHVGMNVQDKEGFYHAIRRRLKPGAPFIVYDMFRGDGPAPRYPMPWADTATDSHLERRDLVEDALSSAGFEIVDRDDDTEKAAAFMTKAVEKAQSAGGPPPLGLHLVLGPVFAEIAPNLLHNLSSGAMRVGVIVCRCRMG